MFPSGIKGKNMLVFHFSKVELNNETSPPDLIKQEPHFSRYITVSFYFNIPLGV